MKTLILFLTIIIFSTVNAYSKEAADCKNLKKFSIQYSICKTKVVLSGKVTNSSKKNKGNKSYNSMVGGRHTRRKRVKVKG